MSDRQSGFTLIEMMIVVVVMVPILAAITATSDIVSDSVNTNDRSGEVVSTAHRTLHHVARYVRPGVRSTFRVRATQADIDDAITNGDPVPVLGDWIEPPDGDPRPEIRFQAADGMLSMGLVQLTTPRELSFVMAPGETANGADDDGDGLVDEGRLELRYDSTRAVLADQIESCSFTFQGDLLRVTVTTARRDHSRHVHRASLQQVFYVHNR